ncbi:FtsX-like permease family protein [Streptomyces sp. NPDC000594]|uniref:FtsX-like permease family protein n=1 Tax=Streptomyces sp. NPDC000594 TaxID=3154261 RepID=UPI0033288424
MRTLPNRRPPTAGPLPPTAPGPLHRWAIGLGLGLRFGAFGGREGWTRNALTAVGVGLGVALLLIGSALPRIIDNREQRTNARLASALFLASAEPVTPSATSLVTTDVSTEYRSESVTGHLLRPDGDRPALPPGLARMPAPGEMAVSPALARLLRSTEGAALAERLGHRITDTVGPAGLLDPGELLYYAGSATLTPGEETVRTEGYGGEELGTWPVDFAFGALGTLVTVVLLVPLGVFIATALRFGGERREARLAALRLVGADTRTVRRVAAGESLFGALLGMAVGLVLFAAARLLAGSVRIWGVSAYPSDVVPVPYLAVLVTVAVPAMSVVTALIATGSVAIEPLGVVRGSAPRPRRLGWRLLMPAAGVAILLLSDPLARRAGQEGIRPVPLAVGATLVLLGVVALFPWLIDAVVGRLGRGPLSWQLAVRALQLRGGGADRAIGGIMVAVSGAIALQMVVAGMHEELRRVTGSSPAWGLVHLAQADPEPAGRMERELRRTPGVSGVLALTTLTARPSGPTAGSADRAATGEATGDEPAPTAALTIADCSVLRQLARITSCTDGDTFVAHSRSDSWSNDWVDRTARKGERILLGRLSDQPESTGRWTPWTLPEDSPTVTARTDIAGWEYTGVYATPGAVAPEVVRYGETELVVRLDEGVPDAEDRVRDAAARIDPALRIWSSRTPERDRDYLSVRTGLLAATAATMVLIAASMVIAQIDQVRERRRLNSALLAFGVRRSTLIRSQFWQTVVPVLLGTVVAAGGGVLLGRVLLRMIGKPLADPWLFLPVAATGAGVILLVSLVSLPVLWRTMRSDGLRTE